MTTIYSTPARFSGFGGVDSPGAKIFGVILQDFCTDERTMFHARHRFAREARDLPERRAQRQQRHLHQAPRRYGGCLPGFRPRTTPQSPPRAATSLSTAWQSQSYGPHAGALTIGTSTLLPGQYGDEFAVTRGHLHAVSDRAELYYCLSGRGVMLLETVDGRSEAVELTPGEAVNVPGEWVHRSVNVGDEPFVTLFTYADRRRPGLPADRRRRRHEEPRRRRRARRLGGSPQS